MYKIPCKNCDKVYIGETGRPFVTRLNEHKKEVELKDKTKFTRQQMQSVDEQQNKSAITDHVVKENHVIGWDIKADKVTAQQDGSENQSKFASRIFKDTR